MAREAEMDMQGWISNRIDLPMLKLHKRRERDLSGLHLDLWSCKMLAAEVMGTAEDERCERHGERATDKGFRAGNQTLQSITEVSGQEIDFIVC